MNKMKISTVRQKCKKVLDRSHRDKEYNNLTEKKKGAQQQTKRNRRKNQ